MDAVFQQRYVYRLKQTLTVKVTREEQVISIYTTSFASPSALPVAVACSSFPPLVLAAAADSKDCWKSAKMSSICSVPTEIRIRSLKMVSK
jgi:hypothetical protein